MADQTAAFEDFFRGQTQNLYAHLCLITGNRAEAEELAQDAFLKVWERWDRVADMEEPVGYLYRTAMNLFRKRIAGPNSRFARRSRRTYAMTSSRRRRIDRSSHGALVEVAPRQRAALVLTELIGFSSEEAGAHARRSPGDGPHARVAGAGGDEATPGGQ